MKSDTTLQSFFRNVNQWLVSFAQSCKSLKNAVRLSTKMVRFTITTFERIVTTHFRLIRNRKLPKRYLEIGPGKKRIPSFETLNISSGPNVDYVWDASKPLPFRDNTFDVVYAGHVLEHIPWYMVEGTLKEWVRILKSGGDLEIWVPDALKICKAFVDAESSENNYIHLNGWYKFNPEKDPCIWAAGRIFTYGDGYGNPKSPNWHRALFSPRYLKLIMERAGLKNIKELTKEGIRGHDHGWISLGLKGTKP